MKMFLTTSAALALAVALGSPAFAAGKKSGFGTIEVNTTGGSGKFNPNASTSSTTTVTTTGPKGQLKTGGTANVTSGKTNQPGPNMP